MNSGDKVTVTVTKHRGWHIVECNSDSKIAVIGKDQSEAINRAISVFDLEPTNEAA